MDRYCRSSFLHEKKACKENIAKLICKTTFNAELKVRKEEYLKTITKDINSEEKALQAYIQQKRDVVSQALHNIERLYHKHEGKKIAMEYVLDFVKSNSKLANLTMPKSSYDEQKIENQLSVFENYINNKLAQCTCATNVFQSTITTQMKQGQEHVSEMMKQIMNQNECIKNKLEDMNENTHIKFKVTNNKIKVLSNDVHKKIENHTKANHELLKEHLAETKTNIDEHGTKFQDVIRELQKLTNKPKRRNSISRFFNKK